MRIFRIQSVVFRGDEDIFKKPDFSSDKSGDYQRHKSLDYFAQKFDVFERESDEQTVRQSGESDEDSGEGA